MGSEPEYESDYLETIAKRDRTIVRLRKAYWAAIKLRGAIEKQPVKAVRMLMITRAAVEEYDRRIEELKKEKTDELG